MALPISVCIICKNEEKHIEECLKRLVPTGFEIIVVDTGSTDRSVEIAKKYTEHVYFFEWCNDFSKAKNYAVSKASHDWILSLDSDEYLEYFDADALSSTLKSTSVSTQFSAGRIIIRNRFTQDGAPTYEQVRVSRLFHRRHYGFQGAVHEQIEPLDTQISKTVFDCPITILHVGYDLSEEEMQQKSKRNIDLLLKELANQGDDPYLFYQLGQSYRRIQDYESAFIYFDRGLSMDVDPNLEYVQSMVESFGYTLLDLKRPKDALNLLGVYDTFSHRADFVFLVGLIYMNNGLFEDSIREFIKATTIEEFSVEGTNSYKALYNTAVIYECTGRTTEAVEFYQKCGDYAPAQIRLAALQQNAPS